LKIGIYCFLTDYSIDIAKLAVEAENLGFESLWLPEHPVIPKVRTMQSYLKPGSEGAEELPKQYYDTVDPFVALGKASGVTTKLKLATGICLVPERNPLLLAKEVATLDLISSGRFIFGIGAGWCKEETEIMGGNFERRWSQTRESILAMKELWTQVESEFHGEFYDFPAVYSFPRPVQRPHPPIMLGGNASNVFKRIVEYGNGWIPTTSTVEEVSSGRSKLTELANQAGVDPGEFEISAFHQPPEPKLIEDLAANGANRVILELKTASEDEALTQLNGFANKLLK
jgi:probable F420-dependent oxidoreductase|tara:strand:- start:9414 stop:10271 length:858 start_codon:yes stop_codon:yes gene_type:complete